LEAENNSVAGMFDSSHIMLRNQVGAGWEARMISYQLHTAFLHLLNLAGLARTRQHLWPAGLDHFLQLHI
jgi:alpha-D-ribose 1-methylphosphonate 5-triphosphate synthase subunit PhnH